MKLSTTLALILAAVVVSGLITNFCEPTTKGVDAGDNTSSSEVGGVSSKDKELRQENASLTKDVEDWKHEARHMTDLNKMLIQTNRPVFVAGDKVILRRGCKPTVSITDTKNDITTYVVECAK